MYERRSSENHSAVRVRRSDRERVRAFGRDVLACPLTREIDDSRDYRIGEDFHIALIDAAGHAASADQGATYGAEGVLPDADLLEAVILQPKAEDAGSMRKRIAGIGVKILNVADPRLYHLAPGGQLFLVGMNETPSKYEASRGA